MPAENLILSDTALHGMSFFLSSYKLQLLTMPIHPILSPVRFGLRDSTIMFMFTYLTTYASLLKRNVNCKIGVSVSFR